MPRNNPGSCNETLRVILLKKEEGKRKMILKEIEMAVRLQLLVVRDHGHDAFDKKLDVVV